MTNPSFLSRVGFRFALGLLTSGALIPSAQAAERPNVVLFLVDDLGYMDIGANHPQSFYPTPNIDRLARDGMRFTDGYAACNVCSPTRAALLTGKYPARVNITDWLPGRGDKPNQKLKVPKLAEGLALEEFTLAEALREGGYRTAIVGKWHLGGDRFRPELQGFDVNIGGYEKGHPPSYFSPYKIPVLSDGSPGEFLTERLTDEANRFIAETVGQEQPFFLYFPHYTVHTPLQAPTNRVEEFHRRAAALTNQGPKFARELGRNVRQVQNHPVYAAMMESLDQSVGSVLAQLRTLGVESNTIVIFTSDNGGLSTAEGTPTSNLPLRMGKGWAYEGGVRVPLIVKWPGVTPPGRVNELPTITMDFYPTLLEAARLPARPAQHVDGVSLIPALRGEPQTRGPIFWHYPHYSNQGGTPHSAVRDGDWKLIEWHEDRSVELFNLRRDIGERNNLAEEEPARAAELKRRLAAWRKETGARMPMPKAGTGLDAP
jgi:arylsulfatase A-like enzyme